MGGEGRREQDIAGYFHVVKYLCIYYVLGAKYGFVQSTDCAVQNMDSYFARQSMDSYFARQSMDSRVWAQSTNLRTIHGLRCANN